MMKRFIASIVLIVLAVIVTSCTISGQTNTTKPDTGKKPVAEINDADDQQARLENPIIILDKDGSRIGEIDNQANITAVDKGIIYSVLAMEENSFTGTAEYRFFSLEDNQDILLGKLEDQGYEAAFCRTELNGVIYSLAVKGNPYGASPIPLLLLAFDPAHKTMKTFTVTENGFPYAAMTVSNGTLLIMNHEMTEEKTDKVYQYDPESETMKEVLSFPSSTDSLRGVCASDEGFYLLRLKLNSGNENELYIDRYDKTYGKISEQPLNDILAAAILNIHGIINRQDALNELGMNVSRFAVIDDRYMIYENFGLSRVIVDLQSGETIFAKDDAYSVSTGTGSPVIYRMDFDMDIIAEPEISGVENGKLKPFSFQPTDSHKMIVNVSRSDAGTWAILTADSFPARSGTEVIHIWAE